MALTKEVKYSGEFLEDGQIQVKARTIILEDGVEINSTFHSYIVDVGDDVSNEDVMIQDIASGLHTQARIDARAAVKAVV
jgi:hypothetical protein